MKRDDIKRRIEELCDEIGPVDLGTGHLDVIEALPGIEPSPNEPPEIRELRRLLDVLG